jgi:oligoribonuclease
MAIDHQNLVWIDMEMTGLDADLCHVLEIACLVTDGQLNIIAEGPVIAIHQPDHILDGMDEWCTRVHGQSGLTQRCRESQCNEAQASQMMLAFLREHVADGKSPMCGNSIGQDRRFMAKHMPELEAFFHYRNIDVSTVKELVRRWQPALMDGFSKAGTHQAMDDIRESLNELRYYRSVAFSI